MKDKLKLQKQYIEVKNKYDRLSNEYWNIDEYYSILEKQLLEREIKEQFLLMKSLNKQIYYER